MTASLAEAGKQGAHAQAAARRQDKLAEERVSRAEQQIAALTQARQELDSRVSLLGKSSSWRFRGDRLGVELLLHPPVVLLLYIVFSQHARETVLSNRLLPLLRPDRSLIAR